MNPTKGYVELVGWQKAMDLVESVYGLTRQFPREEVFGLTAQTRRAAVSVASNIAEGQGRRSRNDFRRFVAFSLGSLNELETQILAAGRLGYVAGEGIDDLLALTSEVGRILSGLWRSLK